MSKKKHKRGQPGQADRWGQQSHAGGWGQSGHGTMAGAADVGTGAEWARPGMNPQASAAAGLPGFDNGLLHSLQGLAGSRQTEQFILGALIGAAAVYVLGDEQMRGKIVKAGMRLYSGIAGGFEEIKEQMADLKAEVAAEKQAD